MLRCNALMKDPSLPSLGFAGRAARESPHPHGVPQSGRLRLHHLPPGGHGALAVPASAARLGAGQPEPGFRAAAHGLLHTHCCHALRAGQLPLLPHRDPVREAGRCCEVTKDFEIFIYIYIYINRNVQLHKSLSAIFQ